MYEMNVAVNQARDRVSAATINPLCILRNAGVRARRYRKDPFPLNDDRAVWDERPTLRIEDRTTLDHNG
jgi:hypothetical protein